MAAKGALALLSLTVLLGLPNSLAQAVARPMAVSQQAPLSLVQVRQLIVNATPDVAIARELEARGVSFSIDDRAIEDLARAGAGQRTIERLQILQPKGTVLVRTGQAAASVVVGGRVVGATEQDGTLRIQLPHGPRELVVKKEEYIDSTLQTVLVEAGREIVVDVGLELRPVRLGLGGINRAPPAKVKDVRATYPPQARTSRVQGVVIVEVTTNSDGTVRNARVLRSVPLLDAAALDAAKQWVFEPVVVGGIARPAIFTVTIPFAL